MKVLLSSMNDSSIFFQFYLHYIFCFFLIPLILYSKNIQASERKTSKKIENRKLNLSGFIKNESNHKSVFSRKDKIYAVVNVSKLNLRQNPNTDNSPLQVLIKGTHLSILSDPDKKWVKVKSGNAFQGWVARKHTKFYLPVDLSNYNENYKTTSFKSSLEAIIKAYMREAYINNELNENDKLSIVVQDLSNKELLVSLESRQINKSASTIKVAILHAYMIQRFRGIIVDNEKHRKLIEEMIRFSSNSSTNEIIQLLGGIENIQNVLNKTKLYKNLYLLETIPEDGKTYHNKISAADLNQIFMSLWFKNLIGTKFSKEENKIVSNEMLHLLSLPGHSWLKDRIKAGTCFSKNKLVRLWDKTGFVKGVNGNAGIIEIDTPHGRRAYSIVMFIDRENYHTIKGEATEWFERVSQHMRRISEITFAFFSNRYESYNQCGLPQLIHYTKIAHTPRSLQVSL